ncbi:J domain-containing protein [Arthrobacter globiformis]|uniref:J domain-containing protein n=1 Tax=Arthrobacter globiformis TaxID=1665 RepID=UPI003978433E
MTVPVPDHYAVLRVSRGASPQEIARAYRALMRRHHPDMGSADAVPAELQLIMKAFSVLRDPQRRRAYDREAARSRRTGPEVGESKAQSRQGAAGQEPHPREEHRKPEGPRSGGPQVIPVRVIRRPEPPLRVTPVRWESSR